MDSTGAADSTGTTGTTGDEGTTTEDGGLVPTNVVLSYSQVKQLHFTWDPVLGAEYYQLLEREDPGADYVQVGEDTQQISASLTVPLHMRLNASYVVRACNGTGCSESDPVAVEGTLAEAVGYFKASNTGQLNYFGYALALSADGSTLAVGGYGEGSSATGIDGNDAYEFPTGAGAVYVYGRDERGTWVQQTYVKASNTDDYDLFGFSVALSADGSTLAVGARSEGSSATGIDGDQTDDSAPEAGAVYVYTRDEQGAWAQAAYVKASNTDAGDLFGYSLTLAGDGQTLAVSAYNEASNATGIDGDQEDDSLVEAGAVYVFERDERGAWAQAAYVKASNTDENDRFGRVLALSGDGRTLAVGARSEDSAATGIDGDDADDSALSSGAVYVYWRDDAATWSQQAYIKASNSDAGDGFGTSVSLSEDGRRLAVGSLGEASSATGIGGDQDDDSLDDAGAVYVFERDELGAWSQEVYIKASNPEVDDLFGGKVMLSANGRVLAVNASDEASNATGIGGDQADNSAPEAGAVYVFERDERGAWTQEAYVKAPNTDAGDFFGVALGLAADGSILAVGAFGERSFATGVGGDQSANVLEGAGAVYLY